MPVGVCGGVFGVVVYGVGFYFSDQKKWDKKKEK
jgi:hypothetical protein